ncbi:hypothetical protein PTTG_28703 [Puccinia triticina 1-1 BBBD Race 1]|uniref:Uncharacterized protein n=1 Tax=Puccinia triticina (isolate 1-1 / race 1 (BBBD)) TaxID=630390 RepID=A0A180G9I1_PUCT1|nr:hypothetical protein PTTG_28703 [Puccinia triticina 1-1 BBBD Race 1]WAR58303.1 hypothetical protein PtB15_5B537 [Puccinia triticina]
MRSILPFLAIFLNATIHLYGASPVPLGDQQSLINKRAPWPQYDSPGKKCPVNGIC